MSLHLEITRPLNKASDPGLPLGNATVQFSISTLKQTFPVLSPVVRSLCLLCKSYLTAIKLSMPVDTTTQAILDISPTLELAEAAHMKMQTGPQHAASALEAGVNKAASDSFSTNYQLLVEHVQVFIGVVDKLSEVSFKYFLNHRISIIDFNIVLPIYQGCMEHIVWNSRGLSNIKWFFIY